MFKARKLVKLVRRSGLLERVTSARLRASELLLPAGYYTQMQPVYVGRDWKKDVDTYNDLHDWPHLRDGSRVLQAHLLLDMVRRLPEGDYAELGTFRGNYARMIHARLAPGTTLYCFDTFEGFDERDLRTEPPASGVIPREDAFADTSLALVERNITGGMPSAHLELRKGFFPETFGGLEQRTWRFVLLDADLYAPIKTALEIFWPRLVPGGLLLVHDYLSTYYKGAKLAVDEFCTEHNLMALPWPDRVGSAVLAKAARD